MVNEKSSADRGGFVYDFFCFRKRFGVIPVCFFVYWQKNEVFGNSIFSATSRIDSVVANIT